MSIEMNEFEDGEFDVYFAERVQLGQFDPSQLEEILNSKYAQFLNWGE